MVQQTFIAVKPDGVQRGLVGEIIKRFEKAGLKLAGLKMLNVSEEMAESHYGEHKGKSFFGPLTKFIQEGPVVAMVLEGVGAIGVARKIVGSTEPAAALPGTIRGDFSHVSYTYADKKGIVVKNVIHASANEDDATREIELWFKPEELHQYNRVEELHTL